MVENQLPLLRVWLSAPKPETNTGGTLERLLERDRCNQVGGVDRYMEPGGEGEGRDEKGRRKLDYQASIKEKKARGVGDLKNQNSMFITLNIPKWNMRCCFSNCDWSTKTMDKIEDKQVDVGGKEHKMICKWKLQTAIVEECSPKWSLVFAKVEEAQHQHQM